MLFPGRTSTERQAQGAEEGPACSSVSKSEGRKQIENKNLLV